MANMFVTLTKEGPLGIITLDRPPANSYNLAFMEHLDAVIEEVAADDEIKAAMIVSTSEKFFCGGADIKNFLAMSPDDNTHMVTFAHNTLSKMARRPEVFIAAISGHALGGGLEIALACDIRLAADGKYFVGLPEATLGLLPGNGGTQRLSRLIGAGRALEMMLTGTKVGPQEALELGIVHKLFPADSFQTDAIAYAHKLANGPSKALAYIKRCVYEGIEKPLAEGLTLERDLISDLFTTEDVQEGLTAFVERRDPNFKGR